MNKYAATGLVIAAASKGKRVLVLNHNQRAARDSFGHCMAVVSAIGIASFNVRRANGAERITHSGGGAIIFRSSASNLRGHRADVVFLDSGVDIEIPSRLHQDLLAITSTGGDIVRA